MFGYLVTAQNLSEAEARIAGSRLMTSPSLSSQSLSCCRTGTAWQKMSALALKLGCDECIEVPVGMLPNIVSMLAGSNGHLRLIWVYLVREVGCCLGVAAPGDERSAMLAYAGGGRVDLRPCYLRRCITGVPDLRRRPTGPKPRSDNQFSPP
jgi:hypothetical protein